VEGENDHHVGCFAGATDAVSNEGQQLSAVGTVTVVANLIPGVDVVWDTALTISTVIGTAGNALYGCLTEEEPGG